MPAAAGTWRVWPRPPRGIASSSTGRGTAIRVLLTNDDGVGSPGLRGLAARLNTDLDLVVVAPKTDQSGSGTSMGTFRSARGGELEPIASVGGTPAWCVDGPPAMAVAAAMRGELGSPPDLVVSGINAGMNTGRAVLHSGTVGAALTASTFGGRGCAISLARSDPWHWGTAIEVAAALTHWMLERRDGPAVLNVNVPAVPLALVRGARWVRPDPNFGAVSVTATGAGGMRTQVVLSGTPTPGSDTMLCQDDWVTLTPLQALGVPAFPPVDANRVVSLS